MMTTRQRVLDLLKRHGHSTMSFQVLEPGLHYWFDGDDACIAYADTGGAWVVAGAPIAPPERDLEVLRRFIAEARRRHKRVRVFGLERDLQGERDLRTVHLGDQPEWDPSGWTAAVRRKRSLREQLRRARAKGVRVRAVSADELADPDAPTRARIDALLAHWQDSRQMAPMGFVVHLDPYHLPEERRFLVAEQGDRVVGILAAVPIFAKDGWFLEDVLRDPSAPNGTVELLIDHIMRRLTDEGSRHVTFGLAPLAHVEPTWLRFIRDHTRWLYDFEGLRAFKAKLQPDRWRPIYLAMPREDGAPRAVVDCLKAFARGGFARFGWETLVHRAPLVTRVLALLLVPWTAALALAPARWFPSPAVQAGWIALDIALFAGLMSLAARWRRRLASWLAAAAGVDFALGCAQLVAWNASRARGPLDAALIAAALAAPLFAAAFLGSARNRATRYLARWRNTVA